VALTSVALGVNTIALFLYVLAIHVFKGEELNVSRSAQDDRAVTHQLYAVPRVAGVDAAVGNHTGMLPFQSRVTSS
jgi:hypothetical protein